MEYEIVEISYNKSRITDLNLLEEILKKKRDYAVDIQYLNFLGFIEFLKEISELVKKFETLFYYRSRTKFFSRLKPPSAFGADRVVWEKPAFRNTYKFWRTLPRFFATRKLPEP